MTDIWEAAGATAVLSLGASILFDWLTHRNGNGDNGKAGERTTAKWEMRFAEIFEKVLTQRNSLLKEMLRDVIREELERNGR